MEVKPTPAWFSERFQEWREQLIQEAMRQHARAISHRDFKVGAAALGFRTETNTFEIFGGCNFMPFHRGHFGGSDLKFCAEERAWYYLVTGMPDPVLDDSENAERERRMNEEGQVDFVVALVVMGEPQEDVVSGLEMPTLHPCFTCRGRMQSEREFSPNTVFLGITPDLKTEELFSLRDLIVRHAGNWKPRENHRLWVSAT